ncbi:thioredoxin family protein [Candidatus Micrarchaeota archaeon]|nr:thioredoxin family protein [Candidatus Micrarchaeota archaeon]
MKWQNNPLLIGASIVLIASAIWFIQTAKSPIESASHLLPNVQTAGSIQPFANNENDDYDPQREIPVKPFPLAPEFQQIHGYINAPEGLSLKKDLQGKVVLVDFWTYSCINCIRTLPHLKEWHRKYADKGLVIVGVHSPEFAFEKEFKNVLAAVENNGIEYPVILDNDFVTWRFYENRFWPHKYLVDADGYIRYDHIGEGGYDETEQQIIELLMERDRNLQWSQQTSSVTPAPPDFSLIETPEIYLGYGFARQPLGNPENFQPGEIVSYQLPESFESNLAYLEGDWENENDFVRLISNTGKVALKYKASKLNIVAGSPSESTLFIELDDRPLGENAGDDVSKTDGRAMVKEQKLYNLVSSADYQSRTIVFEVNGKGFELYTFTFG